jgi:hypothetical protein
MNQIDLSSNITNKKAEELRLTFTLTFLKNPRFLNELTYKQIIEKASAFTKEYISYIQSKEGELL